ncbi:MAG TPA: acyl-CoA dehydrogenase family protein [Candidatus Dormibacteraeota bacterium]|nr:acyl-CoA dehydrogenase family protein [Candidatus Dormibacteraeota bacterium]
MDFELTSEQRSLQELVRDFARRSIKPVARELEHSGRYPDEIVAEMKAMGLFGMLVPEEFGGIGLDAVSYSLVFEELSAAWMGVAGILGTHSMACRIIATNGTDTQRRRWLPAMASGELRSGLALTEPGAGSDLQSITTTARREGDVYVIDGTKTWITNARHAGVLPVLVKTDPTADPPHRGMSLVVVESGTPGFSVGKDIPKLGYRGPESSEVSFEACRVPIDNLVGGTEGLGLRQALSALEFGRCNIAGRAVGVAQAALDMALSYAKERHAFGRPIADFQAIQLKLAAMATDIQAARLLTRWAAAKLDQGQRADLETGMAKFFASEVALRATLESMRIHGGYGYSAELEVERLYRDAPLMAIGEGTNEILQTVIAKLLLSG